MKLFNYKDLTLKAQNRAIKDYQREWRETHPFKIDHIDSREVGSILLNDLTEDLYSKFGRIVEVGEV